MKKQKRRLSFLDVGGIPVQPLPQEQQQPVQADPEVERRKRLLANAAKIIQENTAIEQQRIDLRAKRIEAVRASCASGEFEKVEHIVKTGGYLPADIESGKAHEWAFKVMANER